MSSNQTHHPTFWCHDCDMSVHPHSSAVIDSLPPLCPLCHSRNLELMDDPTYTPATTDLSSSFLDSQFFLPVFSEEEGDDSDSHFDSILPTIRIACSDPESEIACAICTEQFVVDVEAKLLPCDHVFHTNCILPWLNSNHNSCPLCRFQLPSPSNSSDISTSTSESSSHFAMADST